MTLRLPDPRQIKVSPWLKTDVPPASFLYLKTTTLILLMVTSVFLCGCATSNPSHARVFPATPSTNDLAAIRKLYMDSAAALSTGNPSELARFYENDAIQFPPNSPALTGWEAIQSELQNELAGIRVAATINVSEVVTTDSWTYARGTYRMVTTPQGGGGQSVATGNWLDILKRQPDRSWKIARSTWSVEQ